METIDQEKAKKPKGLSLIKKLDAKTAASLASLRDKANKKSYGRKVKDTEIIALGLQLIGQADIQALQQRTLSAKDRVNLAHEEYSKAHGRVSLDQFLDKLLKGEISVNQK